jgi:hypothetical protein
VESIQGTERTPVPSGDPSTPEDQPHHKAEAVREGSTRQGGRGGRQGGGRSRGGRTLVIGGVDSLPTDINNVPAPATGVRGHRGARAALFRNTPTR